MKKRIITAVMALVTITTFSGCDKDTLDALTNSYGDITFYNNQSSVGYITVYFNNGSDIIIRTKTATSCNDYDCASFSDVPYGTYSFTASATTGERWNGNATINKDCTLFRLY